VVGQELPPEGNLESTCPECGREMVITRITPILFAKEFEELTLLCQTCDFTKKVKIKRT
jgi:C4-type Zn-finger protein